MQIERDFLLEQKRLIEEQRDKARMILDQTIGAVAMLEVMLNKLAEPEPQVATVTELKRDKTAKDNS